MIRAKCDAAICRLAGLLEKFPLPAGSAQAEMVAAGIKQRCTAAEREVRVLGRR